MDFSQFNTEPQIRIEKKKPRQNPYKKTNKYSSMLFRISPSFMKWIITLLVIICTIYFIISIITKSQNISTLKHNYELLSHNIKLNEKEIEDKYKNDLLSLCNELSVDNKNKCQILIEEQKKYANLLFKSHQDYEDANYDVVQAQTDIKHQKEEYNMHQKTITILKTEITDLKNTITKKQNEYNKLKEHSSDNNNNNNSETSNESKTNIFDIKYLTANKHPSNIIENEDQYNLLNKWIYPSNQLKYGLLYRASRDGLIAENFHRLCDDKQVFNSLVIIQTPTNEIFGGYTFGNWRMNDYRTDKGAFIFNLTRGKKYKVIEPNKAVYSGEHLLVGFGNGDLIVNEKLGMSYYPVSYEGGVELELTNGEGQFQIKEMEVFNLGLVRDY
jgi:hypothetical protein